MEHNWFITEYIALYTQTGLLTIQVARCTPRGEVHHPAGTGWVQGRCKALHLVIARISRWLLWHDISFCELETLQLSTDTGPMMVFRTQKVVTTFRNAAMGHDRVKCNWKESPVSHIYIYVQSHADI